MTSETIIEVVLKLVGNIHPIQETHSDKDAYENQEKLIEVMDACFDEIIGNAQRTDDYAFSVKKIKDRAIEYLDTIESELSAMNADLALPVSTKQKNRPHRSGIGEMHERGLYRRYWKML